MHDARSMGARTREDGDELPSEVTVIDRSPRPGFGDEWADKTDRWSWDPTGRWPRRSSAAAETTSEWILLGGIDEVRESGTYRVHGFRGASTPAGFRALLLPCISGDRIALIYRNDSRHLSRGVSAYRVPKESADLLSVERAGGEMLLATLSDRGAWVDEVNGFAVEQVAHEDRYVDLRVSLAGLAPEVRFEIPWIWQDKALRAGEQRTLSVIVRSRDPRECGRTAFLVEVEGSIGLEASVVGTGIVKLSPGGSAEVRVQVRAQDPFPRRLGGYPLHVRATSQVAVDHSAGDTVILRGARPVGADPDE